MESKQEIAFANEAQFLLVSENSVEDLNLRLRAKAAPLAMEVTRFRPNIVIERAPSLPPYAEDSFTSVMIGDQVFNVRLSLGAHMGVD
jgi:molybdenum cofactor sulfurtransferase